MTIPRTKTPDEFRDFADSLIERACAELAEALQNAGLLAMATSASNKELKVVMTARSNPTAAEEFQNITSGALLDICSKAMDEYVQVARRAYRLDEGNSNSKGFGGAA